MLATSNSPLANACYRCSRANPSFDPHRVLEKKARRSTVRIRLLPKAVSISGLVHSVTSWSVKRRQTH